MEDEPNRLLTLVPWSLQRLLGGEYEVTCDSNGMPQSLDLDPDYGAVSIEKMEEDLKACGLDLKARGLPWDGLDRLSASRDHLTPDLISEALAKAPVPPRFLAREELLHAEYPDIVAAVYWGWRRFGDFILHWVISSRAGLGGSNEAALEDGFRGLIPDALPREVVRYVVREMSETFPAIVERVSTFRVIPVTSAVPTPVAQYAREASRCYLHGFFAACLILCRSCVESAVETKLDQEGHRKALDALPFNRMQEMLNLALSKGVLDDLTLHMAHEIRKSANKAVHGTVPSEAECRDRLEQTREVLRHLYETPVPDLLSYVGPAKRKKEGGVNEEPLSRADAGPGSIREECAAVQRLLQRGHPHD